MFTPKWTPEAQSQYEKLRSAAESAKKGRKAKGKSKSSKQEGLFKQVHKAITLLLANPKHPGLQTHAYDSITCPYDESAKVFEAYAQNNTSTAYRVFWCYGPGKKEITLIAITSHP